MCLWTSPREWIEDYGCHDPALEGLNIYNVMENFDNKIWNYLYAEKWQYSMAFTTGINHLMPEENQETYKTEVLRGNQKDFTEQWKTYWPRNS